MAEAAGNGGKKFKETLNLPRTDFPIRANAAENDAKLLERWQQEKLYEKAMQLHAGQEQFILHDGPPYANGHIHLGTAYNKILKDIVAKSHRMLGKHVPVVPGWDCHGLPIELKVSQENKGAQPEALMAACRAYAAKWIDVQRQEFKKLGVLMDWDHPYQTMDHEYEATIVRSFAQFVEKGYIERKNKTVPWCASCQTVLAAAEIEYHERKDPSTYVLFPLEAARAKKLFPTVSSPVHMLAWTTTPWTLALNRALVLKPEADYQLLEANGTFFIVGAALAQKVCDAAGVTCKKVAQVKAEDLAGAQVEHPFIDGQMAPILTDPFVSLEDGTACVHSAPGCGPEDYDLGVKHGLEIYSPLTADGRYTDDVKPAELAGMAVTDAQWQILKILQERGRLFHKGSIRHPYPHCWRCRNPLMFRATKQWFCDLSHNNLRDRALQAIEELTFLPANKKNHLRASVQGRLEWCLSRQRVWGVPIPALLCNACDAPFIRSAFVAFVADGIAQQGVEYWRSVSLDELITQAGACAECGSTDLHKEFDILDVWFDAGVSHAAVLKQRKALAYPADLYLEGIDQHRGWFQSSLLTSLVLNDTPAMRAIFTHGYTVDKNGRKMSKSLGNVVAPQEVIDKLGTDGLRVWTASVDYEGDAVMSDVLVKNVQEVQRKIRNTCRFMLSNLYDFDHQKDAVPADKLLPLDRHALAVLADLNKQVIADYQAYKLTAVYRALGDYCAVDLSPFYLDIIKDRLYVEQPDGHKRRSAQTICWHILDTLTRLMAPILSFTAEQLADYYQKGDHPSIHLQQFVDAQALPAQKDVSRARWRMLRELREAVLKAIEEQRTQGIIKHSLEAAVTLHVADDAPYAQMLKAFDTMLKHADLTREKFLKEFFVVSRVQFAESASGLEPSKLAGLSVRVEHAPGIKCPRCWHWHENKHTDSLCARCEQIIES